MILVLIVFVYFSLGWAYAYKTNKYSWIDFFWSSSFVLLTASLLALNKQPGLPAITLSAMYLFWSLRLSTYLFTRIKNHGEDKRYLPLIKRWGNKTAFYFYLVFIGQGFLNLILIMPLRFVYKSQILSLNYLQILAVMTFIISLAMEALADSQLKKFISKPENKGLVCKVGLWRYSRHPNYFFESLIWLSFGLFSFTYSPFAMIPYAIMLFLLRFVTGVPPAEASSLKSKPENFRIYQQETNIFVPWLTKHKEPIQ